MWRLCLAAAVGGGHGMAFVAALRLCISACCLSLRLPLPLSVTPPPLPLLWCAISIHVRECQAARGNRVGGSAGLACGKIRVRSVLLLAAEKAIAEAKAKANAAAADDDEDKRNVWG